MCVMYIIGYVGCVGLQMMVIKVLVQCFAHTYCSLNRAHSVINLHQGANNSGPVTPTRSPWIQTSIASVCKCMFHKI